MISALDVFVNRVKIKIQISVFTRMMYVESVVIIGIQHIARRGGLTMAEIDLKRCPFCGGYAHLDDPSEMGDYGVSCENCGAFVMFGTEEGECQTKEEAMEAWNRRADDGNS